MSDLDQRDIKIVSIAEPRQDEVPDIQPRLMAKVTFRIRGHGPEFPIFVRRDLVSDEDLISVARHYLHMQTRNIADATASWRLSDEDYQRVVPSSKTPPNKGPAIPM